MVLPIRILVITHIVVMLDQNIFIHFDFDLFREISVSISISIYLGKFAFLFKLKFLGKKIYLHSL